MKFYLIPLICASVALASAAYARSASGPQPADWSQCKFELMRFCPNAKTQQDNYDCLKPLYDRLSQSCKSDAYAKYDYLLSKNAK